MPIGLKMTPPLTTNKTLIININNSLSENNDPSWHPLTHWYTRDNSLHFSMHGENIIEHTNGKCYVLTI